LGSGTVETLSPLPQNISPIPAYCSAKQYGSDDGSLPPTEADMALDISVVFTELPALA